MGFDRPTGPVKLATTVGMVLCLWVTSLTAETYRWKDKNGKVHYGAMVPAEYADQPYDILNAAGLVIEHVDPASFDKPVDASVENVVKKEPLIPEEERQRQTDRLLVIQYKSENDIRKARDLEIAQLGYDSKLIKQSQESTEAAIRDQIKMAADQQRANVEVNEEQKKNLEKLYVRRINDQKKLAAVEKREQRIRNRFNAIIERYRYLTSEKGKPDEARDGAG